VQPGNRAYMIHGSSAAGVPQAVALSHRNIARLVSATQERLGFTSQDCWCLTSENRSDTSIWEMWGALLHGGRLVIADQKTSTPEALLNLIRDRGITVLSLNSAIGHFMLAREEQQQELPLRYVLLSGDDSGPEQHLSYDGLKLVKTHGAVEASIYFDLEMPAETNAPGAKRGSSLPGVRVYVLDAHGK